MKLIFKILIGLLVSISLSASDFTSYQKVLDAHLVDASSKKMGYATAFNYLAASNSIAAKSHISAQKKLLASFNPAVLKTKNEMMAFWINVYNFSMLHLIVENGVKKGKVISSVKDLSGFNPYSIFGKKYINVNGEKLSLDQVEKGMLLGYTKKSVKKALGQSYKKKGWVDARVHFAVNCASVGCPPLNKKIYTPENVNSLLDKNTREAMASARHMLSKGDHLHVTSLFKWYKDDFKQHSGSVKGFIKKYVKDKNVLNALSVDDKYTYIDYDWDLNIPANFK